MPTRPAPYPFNHLAAVRHLRARDPKLAALITRVGRFRMSLQAHEHPFESLLTSILYQQIHGAAAAAILARVKQQIGDGGFPSPQQILAADDAALRATGLSRQKIAALRDLAAKTHEGVVPAWDEMQAMEDGAIIARLTQVRGVGEWTVHMLLMFRLGRADVLPTLDYGIRNGYQLAYRKRKMPTPRELAQYGERWRPYRSVASWYLWQAVHLERAANGLKRKATSKAR
ncbi:MAG: DNA-3-methyladenine glycosylase family protein [Terriglobales bacterium]